MIKLKYRGTGLLTICEQGMIQDALDKNWSPEGGVPYINLKSFNDAVDFLVAHFPGEYELEE